MAQTTVAGTTVAEVMAELAELEDPRARAINARHGDDHGVNLGQLRAVAKRLKTQKIPPVPAEIAALMADVSTLGKLVE